MMKTVSIDLAEKGPETSVGVEKPVSEKKYYPSLHLSGEELGDLPDSGKILVSFRKTREEVSRGEGGKHYSCTLEVHAIEGVEADEGESKGEERPEEAFEKRYKEYKRGKKED